MKWQTVVVSFGKYKGKTFLEVAQKDPGYLRWMCEKFDDGLFKKAAGEAIQFLMGAAHRQESPELPSSIKIALLRDGAKLPGGMLAIRVSEDLRESFEELHETCRQWDVAGNYWVVPTPLLGDILERFPKAELYGELQSMVDWTTPVNLARGSNITPIHTTALPEHPKSAKKSKN